MSTKAQRRQLILDLIAEKNPSNHSELQDWLADKGIHATQATLSRDLRDLGVVKGPGGYRIDAIDGDGNGTVNGTELKRVLRQTLLGADHGQNLVVLHTRPGNANALAFALDHGDLPGMLGSLAGDDTILLATRNTAGARALTRRLRSLAGHR